MRIKILILSITLVLGLHQVASVMAMEFGNKDEYQRHQEVSNRFFRIISRKPEVRKLINTFKIEINFTSPTPINLDGMSSRSRILLFRELTAFCCAKPYLLIPFVYNEKHFKITLKPNLRQPGCGIINSIGTCSEIYRILHKFPKEAQQKLAHQLLIARKKLDNKYNQPIPNPILSVEGETSLDLEMLNILLDFEVARRLQGTEEEELNSAFSKKLKELEKLFGSLGLENAEEFGYVFDINEIKGILGADDDTFSAQGSFITNIKKSNSINENKEKDIKWVKSHKMALDRIPIASAIIDILKLSSREEHPELLEIFFHAPHNHYSGYSYGEYSVFEGVPSEFHREIALKKILEKTKKDKNLTKEEIHKEYLEYFGGDSESEGDDYEDD